MTSSADGTKLALESQGSDYIFTSTDYGATWTQSTGSGARNWQGLASDSTGLKLAGAPYNDYIYTTSDGGSNWTQRTGSGSRTWSVITSSSDGSKLAAAVSVGYIYTSTDSGINWTEQTLAGSRAWNAIASSANGSQLIAAVNGGYVYISTDSGATWATSTGLVSGAWTGVASSADGTRLVAVNYNNNVHISTDSGATWTTITSLGTDQWYAASCSLDCVTIAVISNNGLFTSINGGTTWVNETNNGLPGYSSYRGVAVSADGSRIGTAYTGSGGAIWTYLITPVAPTVTAQDASDITLTTATLNGTMTVGGTASSTSRGFNYGLTTAYDLSASSTGLFGPGTFSQNLTGLTPGATYHFQAYAVNSVGTGTSSDMTFVAGSTEPDAPTSVTAATSSPNEASVSFTAPVSDGGSSILYYVASSTPGDITATSTASPILVSNLTNDVSYTFVVYAVNAVGTSSSSSASNAVTPVDELAVLTPSFSSITGSGAMASSTITSTGGSDVVIRGFNYGTTIEYGTVASSTGSFGTGAFSNDLSSLTCNTLYHVQAFATNLVGTETSSDATFTTSACVPGTPTSVTAATSFPNQATVSWTAPSTGGSPILHYSVLSDPAAYSATTTGTEITASGLSNGTSYTFTVSATNAIGTSATSTPSNAVTPSANIPVLSTPPVATLITATSAVLNGTINADGGASTTVRGFNYGSTSSYGLTSTQSFTENTWATSLLPAGDTPTVDLGIANAASQISNSVLVPYTDSRFLYSGASTTPRGATWPNNLVLVSYATASGAALPWYAEFTFTGQSFELYEQGVSGSYQLYVNGEPTTEYSTESYPANGNFYLTKFTFSTSATRDIKFHFTGFTFGGVRIGPDDTLAHTSQTLGRRAIFIGDSYTEQEDTYAQFAGRMLGWETWSSGIGGTGYINDNNGTKQTFLQRLQTDVVAWDPDVVVVAGGINDSGGGNGTLQTAAETYYSAVRSALPDAEIIVLGPFWPRTSNTVPPTIDSNIVANRDAIRSAASTYNLTFVDTLGTDPATTAWISGDSRGGCPINTGNSCDYIGSDGTHPIPAGRKYLGIQIANAILAQVPDLASSAQMLYPQASTNTYDGVSSYSQVLTGLTCGTTYHYQSFATNTGGTGTSVDRTFTTSACPVSDSPSSSSGSRSSGGSTVQSRVNNLVKQGNTEAAETLKAQYPNLFSSDISQPTTSVTTFNLGNVNLKNGSSGESVKELQRFLNAQLNLGLAVDGILGPKTLAVIKKWQTDHNLVPDGIVGSKTKAEMKKILQSL